MNLNRSSFLRYALGYIQNNPGCCKADIIGTCFNGTRAYRYQAIDRLIQAGLVRNYSTNPSKYCLVVKEYPC